MAKINFSTLPSSSITIIIIIILLFSLPNPTLSATFTFTNKCPYTVWPGLLSGAGTASLSTTGFSLSKDESKSLTVPSSWSGRLWGRTLCSLNSSGKFSCVTADCGSGTVECSGAGATPPATLAEFTLNGAGGLDFYDVSLVDGYNLPMLVVPNGGSGDNCSVTGCVVDLNDACPSDLKVMGTDGGVACRSACEAFGEPRYCCSGAFGTPGTCKPSSYSEAFKSACPRAYSYAYDDKTSTFTCGGAPDYLITFCSEPTTSKKATTEQGQGKQSSNTNTLPIVNSSMIYEGAQLDVSGASSSTHTHLMSPRMIVGALPILAAIWRLCQLF